MFDLSTLIQTLSQPPGDLIFYLVVGFSLLLTSLVAFANQRRPESRVRASHVLIGSGVLFLLHAILFIISQVLPPEIMGRETQQFALTENFFNALTVIWLVWIFIEKDQHFILTGICIFISLALVFIGIILLVVIAIPSDIISDSFQLILTLWRSGVLGLILVSFITILLTRPQQWLVGTAILLMLGAGYLLQIISFSSQTSPMGAVRFAQTLAFPWLIVLVQRFADGKNRVSDCTQEKTQSEDHKPADIKPILVEQLLQISLAKQPEVKHQAAVKAVSLSAVSDICYLVKLSEDRQSFKLIAGYDLIREVHLKTTELACTQLPTIAEAWGNRQFALLSPKKDHSPDIATLTSLLRYHNIGNLLAYPLGYPGQDSIGGVILLSPYTNKPWGEETLTLLAKINESLTQVLFPPDSCQALMADLDRVRKEREELASEITELQQALAEKEAKLSEHAQTIKRWKARYQIDKVDSVQRIDHMQAQIQEFQRQIDAQQHQAAKLEQLTDKIRQLTSERDRLQTSLSRATAQIKDFESQQGQTGPIRLSMDNQIVSLDSIVANIKVLMAAEFQHRNIELEVINPDAHGLIKTDPELLQTVLHGLLENALQASKASASIQLDLKLSFETGMLIIQLTDYGDGLTPGEQTALFSADHQHVPGIGSIESIRKAIRAIRVLNGKVWLRSKKEVFTTFRVQFPVRIID